MKSIAGLSFFILLCCGLRTLAQDSLGDEQQKAAEVRQLIKSGHYTFEASKMVMPGGRSMEIKRGNDLDISRDTLIAYLPDLGKSLADSVNAQAAGITVTRFNYSIQPSPRGGWDVRILPEENISAVRDVRNISIHIKRNGYATLRVQLARRSQVFYGYIMQHAASFPQKNQQAGGQ